MTTGQKPIRVVLIEDHAIVRDGLCALLSSQDDISVVATADTGRSGLKAVDEHKPDVVLMDLRLPELDGLTAVSIMQERYPQIAVLILSSAEGDKAIERCLQAGARGYLLKSAQSMEVIEAIRAVAQGGRYISPAAALELATGEPTANLTPREIEVLESVLGGMSNAEIGKSLGVAEKTIKNQLHNVYLKLKATDRTHAVTIALQRGIIELPRRA